MAKEAETSTSANIFNLFLRLLPSLRIPLRGSNEDTELRSKLDLTSHPDDAAFVAKWIGKLVLLSIVRPAAPGATCPGLAVKEYEFLTLNGSPDAWDPNTREGLNLTLSKITALNFLASGAFTDEERFFPALSASADTNSRISSIGEDMLKRTTISLEVENIIRELFRVYFTAKPAMKTRLLGMLSRSKISTTFTSQVLKLVEEGIRPHDNTNLPAKGLEATKFYNQMFVYMNWVSSVGSTEDVKIVAPKVVDLLKGFIEDQGWPIPHERSVDGASLRALAYEDLGLMAKVMPGCATTVNLQLVRWLFRSLTEDNSANDVAVSIDSAMASLLQAFDKVSSVEVTHELKSLLLEYMVLQVEDNITRSARFAAVRWANRCLGYDDVVARWIDILGISGRTDEKNDVIEEGRKGLVSHLKFQVFDIIANLGKDPYWFRLTHSMKSGEVLKLPDWSQLVKVFYSSHSMLEGSSSANAMKSGMDLDGITSFGNFSGDRINAFATSIAYCRRILFLRALQESDLAMIIDADWERQLEVLVRSDRASCQVLQNYIKATDSDSIQIFLAAAFEGMLQSAGGHGTGECGRHFIDVASLASSSVIQGLSHRSEEVMPCIRSNNAESRYTGAQILGMLAAHPSSDGASVNNIVSKLLQQIQLWPSATGAEINAVHGSILSIGHILSRLSFYGRSDDLNNINIEEIHTQLVQLLQQTRDTSLRDAVFHYLSELCAAGMPIQKYFDTPLLQSKTFEIILDEAKKGNEKAIKAMGRIALVLGEAKDDAEDLLSKLIDHLYGLFEAKQAETLFAIGDALGVATAAWDSESLQFALDVDATFKGCKKRTTAFQSLIDRLLTDSKTTKPSLKKATSIWLFTLIQHCGHLVEIQTRLRACQAAFMGLLSARDELVQETASRGLSLVYERGDEDLKAKLVRDLVASFTGASASLKVEEDTELFEPGALPTGEGKSVTSYKDIISLASEVGDQSLVYKFMSLAANAATWSTRSAFGRFGLSNILSQSEVDPKLFPKLYRYRFDPNPNVRRSMNDIWNALVKDPSKTINENFDAILQDLLKSILNKEWRTREASCAAIADLVQGRDFEMYESHLAKIWQVAFKVMDDIKGSVRSAAMKLSMALTGILVRQVEAGTSSKHAQAMLKEVLPFLLSGQGLESSAEDVRVFATVTILKLIKSGGKVLLPFVPNLVEQLLGLLSTLEMEGVDYLYLNAAKYKLTEEKIDTARTSAVSQSPLMEAIERCLDVMDDSTMAELVPRLENVIKTAVGMPSKIGCSGILVSLATRHANIFRPHADVFLKIVEKSVVDRNSAVSAAYARSSGYLARLASENAILRLLKFGKDNYLEAEDESRRQVAADIIYAVSKFATDRFNALASSFLPLVFFAKHDFDKHVQAQFERTWSENVGGSRAVLLYMTEITAYCQANLESPRWTIKHTAALAIADAVISAGKDISTTTAATMWPALEKALALKTFDGKEKVLEAFINFVRYAKSFWQNEATVAAATKKIAIREAKRNNTAYRQYAYICLGDYCQARRDIEMFDDIHDIVAPILEELVDEDTMETTEHVNGVEKSHDGATITTGTEALIKAVNTTSDPSTRDANLKQLLKTLRLILASTRTGVATRAAFYENIKVVFVDIKTHEAEGGTIEPSLILEYFDLLDITSGSGAESVRLKRAEAAVAITSMLGEGHGAAREQVREAVTRTRNDERALSVQIALDRALLLLK